jgi:uncharacterized protein YcfJ
MRNQLKVALGVAGIVVAAHASAQVTFYEREGFRGRAFTAGDSVKNFGGVDFNDRASSAVVENGRWEVCEHIRYEGKCVVLRPGSYDSLASMGLNNSISSVRPFDRAQAAYDVPPPLAAPNYEYRRRPDERVYEANVTSVRAVVGAAEQRCWVERQQIADDRSGANIPGAIIGGVIGGVLGHQVGSGRGRDVATAGGAVAGAAIGANVGRNDGQVYSQDVQRCTNVSSNARPAYYDVTYNFNGIEHRVQLSAPPGPTIAVNSNGEPRG